MLAVVGVLLAVAFPALSRSRTAAREMKCLANARQLGSIIVAYSVDYKGFFPTWVTDGPSTASNEARWRRYTQQAGRLFNRTRWIEYSGLDASQPVYRCPANGEYRAVGRKAIFDYYGSDAMYADPKFLDPDLPREAWEGKFGGRAQFIDSVRFPSAKVGFFEWYVWHAWRGAYVEGPVERRGLSVVETTGASTMWFLDGSASGLRYADALPSVERGPYWYSHPVFLTAHGVWGRDRAPVSAK